MNELYNQSLPSPSGKTPSCLSPGIEQPLHFGGKIIIKLIVAKIQGNAVGQPILFPGDWFWYKTDFSFDLVKLI